MPLCNCSSLMIKHCDGFIIWFSYFKFFAVSVFDKAENTTPRPCWWEVFHKNWNASNAKLGSWWEQVLLFYFFNNSTALPNRLFHSIPLLVYLTFFFWCSMSFAANLWFCYNFLSIFSISFRKYNCNMVCQTGYFIKCTVPDQKIPVWTFNVDLDPQFILGFV